jgi:acyl-CoA synthetase (AMP-forming)/AMP-acid ligase II
MSILKEEMKNLRFEERLRYMVATGRPFYNVQLKVVKDDGSEVIADEKDVGEIIVKGDTISPSYWELPKETEKRIVGGWLYTRDLAVVNPEGYVTIVDRKEDMIITGGENVYSIEVEDVLYSHPNILEAAVIGLPDPIWGEKVCAVVVLKGNKDANEDEIIKFCKDKMAHFKAPKTVFFADQLPKTGSSKIYKYKLREIYGKGKQ